MEEKNQEAQSLEVQLSSGIGYRQISHCIEAPNPYYKYLLKLEAAKNTQLGPKLSEKSEQVTTAIIRNFLDWYNSLGGVDISIDESTLRHLFRVGFDVPRAEKKSIARKNTKRKSQPKPQTDHQRSSEQSLQKPDKSKAFGILGRNENSDIIWEGIRDLNSVKAFADWLRRDPSIQAPDNLSDENTSDTTDDNCSES